MFVLIPPTSINGPIPRCFFQPKGTKVVPSASPIENSSFSSINVKPYRGNTCHTQLKKNEQFNNWAIWAWSVSPNSQPSPAIFFCWMQLAAQVRKDMNFNSRKNRSSSNPQKHLLNYDNKNYVILSLQNDTQLVIYQILP